MTQRKHKDSAEELLARFDTANVDERSQLMKTPEFRALARKSKAQIEAEPRIGEVIAQALLEQAPARVKDAVDALGIVIWGMSQIAKRPEVQKSPEVLEVVTEVHAALSSLTMFQTNKMAVADAFAYPAQSFRNSLAGSKLRTDEKALTEAYGLYKRWVANPGLYETKAAFSRDMMNKGLCDDLRTPPRWLALWSKDLPQEHPLRQKLGKLPKR